MTKQEELYVRQQIACIRWNECKQQEALLGMLGPVYGRKRITHNHPTVPDGITMRAISHLDGDVPNVEAARRYKRNAARAFHNAVRVAQIPKEVLIRAAAECSPT